MPGRSLETIPADFHFELEQAVLNNYSDFWLPYPNYNLDSGNINLYFPLCSELPNAPIITTETVQFIVTMRIYHLKETVRHPCYIMLVNFLQQMPRYRCLSMRRTRSCLIHFLETSDTVASWQRHIRRRLMNYEVLCFSNLVD